MLYNYLNQETTWLSQTTTLDDYGKVIYSEPQIVACRKSEKQSLYTSPKGDTFLSVATYIVVIAVQVGDTLDGMEVKQIFPFSLLDGVVFGYRAVV